MDDKEVYSIHEILGIYAKILIKEKAKNYDLVLYYHLNRLEDILKNSDYYYNVDNGQLISTRDQLTRLLERAIGSDKSMLIMLEVKCL